MTTAADVCHWLDEFAPHRLAESWDNVGLLWGDPARVVSKVMTCLTVTDTTADEAINEKADLILSHHPVLFKAVKQVRADRPATGMLWKLARAGVAIASPHTAFDNTVGGINDGLAGRLGLQEVGPLRPAPAVADPNPDFKVVVFAPRADRDALLASAFAAGAGRIGAYRECSFSGGGLGSFFGEEGANPAVGEAGRRESVREARIEFLCPGDRLAAVLTAIRSAHSYEEPAIDVYPLHSAAAGPGVGRVGVLPAEMMLRDFVESMARAWNVPRLQFAGHSHRLVRRVAVACGAGDDFLGEAARAGAHVLVTGEARYHRAVEAEALGIGLVVIGHHESEWPGVVALSGRVAKAFPDLETWPSRRERDPLTWASAWSGSHSGCARGIVGL